MVSTTKRCTCRRMTCWDLRTLGYVLRCIRFNSLDIPSQYSHWTVWTTLRHWMTITHVLYIRANLSHSSSSCIRTTFQRTQSRPAHHSQTHPPFYCSQIDENVHRSWLHLVGIRSNWGLLTCRPPNQTKPNLPWMLNPNRGPMFKVFGGYRFSSVSPW
jgi:hypothetical protein